MRALYIRKHGGPDVLEVRESEPAALAAGELQVRVAAVGLNFAELLARQGLYPLAPKPPCVVGYEGAGTVVAVADDVTDIEVGTRVLFLREFGAHSEFVNVPRAQLAVLPDRLGFEEAAAIPVNYFTAYRIVFDVARVRAGDRVLVHAAAGGVGTAIAQLCRMLDTRDQRVLLLGTCSQSKHDFARGNGYDALIDYHAQDYVAAVRNLVGPHGLDFVFDPMGGEDSSKGYDLLSEGGQLVCYGMSNVQRPGRRHMVHALRVLMANPRFRALDLMRDNHGVAGVQLGMLWARTDILQRTLERVVELYMTGIVRPQIDSVHAFDRAHEAHARLEQGRNAGKVLLVP